MNKEKQKKLTIFIVLICSLIGLICTCAFVFVCYSFVFVIADVGVEGNFRTDAEDIVVSSEIEVGSPIYSISKSDIAAKIKRANPYVESVSIKRRLPSDIRIIVTESTPSCFVRIGDEYSILSDEIRVLEHTDSENAARSMTGCRLILPDISHAMLGEKIEFETLDDTEYILETLSAVFESDLNERIEVISVKDKFGIYVVCDGLYRIECGNVSDMAQKLKVAEMTIDSGVLQEGVMALIDVSDPNESTAVLDKNLILVKDEK